MKRARLVIATRNAGKVREYGTLLKEWPIDLRHLGAQSGAPHVQESSESYLYNARAKARSAARFTGLPALADDSGLEVDALAGAPGVRSARFAGQDAGDEDNVAMLLERLEHCPPAQRTARFRCVIVVARADGVTRSAEGTCEGRITGTTRGGHGFGYDPVFEDPASGLTFAELDEPAKNRISHRAAACRALPVDLLDFLLGLC